MTAPAQHVSSVAAVERFISEIGAALERRGTEPSALRRVRERIQAHLVVQNGVTDAAVVETRLKAADGSTFDADVVFFDPSSRPFKLMHSWGFAIREGLFAETKEGICRNKD